MHYNVSTVKCVFSLLQPLLHYLNYNTSQVVIPIQFVLFTLSAIVGSAILYGDFKHVQFHQFVTFLYGCLATFLGVFIIAWAPSSNHSHLEFDFDAEGEGERAAEDVGDANSEERDRLERDTHPGSSTGSIGRRKVLVLPPGTPVLRRKRSSVGLIGLSPAQVHLPSHFLEVYPDFLFCFPSIYFLFIHLHVTAQTIGIGRLKLRERLIHSIDGEP